MTEDFEGTFPGTNWLVGPNIGYADAYWDDQNYRAYNGSWSGYCADAGSESVSPGSNYPNNMDSWMIYGPFDLSDVNDARLSFYYWVQSEKYVDMLWWMASLNDSVFYGHKFSGNSEGWIKDSLDLKNVPVLGDVTGESQVWIAFVFESNNANSYEGAYIDDIFLQKAAWPDLQWTNIVLSTESWKTGDNITADLTVVNNGNASAGAQYSRIYLSTDAIITSSDVQLGKDINFSSINAGNSQVKRTIFNVPDVTGGTYYLGAQVDYYDDVAESDETNNIGISLGTVTVIPVSSNIGIDELNDNSDYLLYPNPTNCWLTIESPSPDYSFTVYSLEGKIMVNKVLHEKMNNIDLSNLNNGVYIIKLENSKNVIIKKLIKQ
jgi:hypothetical protein